jgi:Predicted methyltransferase regulatory domain
LNPDAALAFAFAQRVVDSGAAYFRTNPGVATWLKKLGRQNRHYLAHEYFTRDWQPMPLSQVAEWLSQAKLSFCASADLLTHVDEIHLTREWKELLGGIKHPTLRESVRDYLLAQQFRRDIFIKGGCTMLPPAIESARPRCEALNAYLCQRARHTGDAAYLASPPAQASSCRVPANCFCSLGSRVITSRKAGRDSFGQSSKPKAKGSSRTARPWSPRKTILMS